ncbi:hypothetical protein H6F92_18295 [Microcystis wesenbergii FACHB-1317]|uniref:hypothetical protein n=1 Tax=Microcystis wesenbergii TaxID=44823 RepID=UPI001680889A|nr:hypothetical protein [Microcystis wesenbergii]MBD2290628.1 hypothetical protein [Microcystis wesenbergii FACHB-1317]
MLRSRVENFIERFEYPPEEKQSSKILGLKPRRSTTALLLNMSIVYEIYAKM